MSEVPLHVALSVLRGGQHTPELTRGNRKSQFQEFTGRFTSKVNSRYLSRSQWLQLPNLSASGRI